MPFTGTIANAAVTLHDPSSTEMKTWQDALTALSDPWTSYSPALTNITIGNGTIVGAYVQVGKLIHFRWTLTWGSTTAFTGSIAIGMPVTGADAGWAGSAFLFDASVAANRQPGTLNGSTTANNVHSAGIGGGGAGIVNATSPFTWAVSDVIKGSGTYEAA